ncbi:MAG: hypothetical protein OEZ23_03195 [Gammaproteobacteria bacterium]|nr:hypothetical protein [Gammaproteobacteria bacterium]
MNSYKYSDTTSRGDGRGTGSLSFMAMEVARSMRRTRSQKGKEKKGHLVCRYLLQTLNAEPLPETTINQSINNQSTINQSTINQPTTNQVKTNNKGIAAMYRLMSENTASSTYAAEGLLSREQSEHITLAHLNQCQPTRDNESLQRAIMEEPLTHQYSLL